MSLLVDYNTHLIVLWIHSSTAFSKLPSNQQVLALDSVPKKGAEFDTRLLVTKLWASFQETKFHVLDRNCLQKNTLYDFQRGLMNLMRSAQFKQARFGKGSTLITDTKLKNTCVLVRTWLTKLNHNSCAECSWFHRRVGPRRFGQTSGTSDQRYRFLKALQRQPISPPPLPHKCTSSGKRNRIRICIDTVTWCE